jgi:hypothetical protein
MLGFATSKGGAGGLLEDLPSHDIVDKFVSQGRLSFGGRVEATVYLTSRNQWIPHASTAGLLRSRVCRKRRFDDRIHVSSADASIIA